MLLGHGLSCFSVAKELGAGTFSGASANVLRRLSFRQPFRPNCPFHSFLPPGAHGRATSSCVGGGPQLAASALVSLHPDALIKQTRNSSHQGCSMPVAGPAVATNGTGSLSSHAARLRSPCREPEELRWLQNWARPTRHNITVAYSAGRCPLLK